MTMRSGLIKDEMAQAKRAVEEGMDKETFAKAFKLMDSAANHWFKKFTPDIPPPVQTKLGGPTGSGMAKAPVTPKATKKED